jgi:hypothetical protein
MPTDRHQSFSQSWLGNGHRRRSSPPNIEIKPPKSIAGNRPGRYREPANPMKIDGWSNFNDSIGKRKRHLHLWRRHKSNRYTHRTRECFDRYQSVVAGIAPEIYFRGQSILAGRSFSAQTSGTIGSGATHRHPFSDDARLPNDPVSLGALVSWRGGWFRLSLIECSQHRDVREHLRPATLGGPQ